MCSRCTNPKARSYSEYGGRGITVVQEWRGPGGFERFIAHIGPRPSRQHSIDRRDNERGYEPGNVRWATAFEQNRNRRDNRMITVGDRTLCVADWARETGKSVQVIHGRIKHGWPADLAVMTPIRGARPKAPA